MSTLTMLAWMLAVAAAVVACRLAIRERRRTDARVAALTAAIDGQVAPAVANTAVAPELFRAGATPDGRPLRLALGLGAAAIAGVLVLGASLATEAGGEVAGVPAPLELLSMSHERAGTSLIVNGRVRQMTAAPTRLEAEVLAFAADGRQVGSGRGPLVFGTGDDAGFRITIAEAPDAARYRVGFRSGADAVRHVDRRRSSVGAQ